MRVALVADWLPTFGGAEHVIAALHDAFPKAPIFTTVARLEKLGRLQSATIHTNPLLQLLFRVSGTHTTLLPLMPAAMERIDLRGYNVIVSSSHAVGKGIVPPSGARHICYCHTPMRYAWEMEDTYLRDFRVPRFLRKPIRKELMRLRRWDMTTAKRVDMFIANSSATQERIQRIYGRTSDVIHPPVEDPYFSVPVSERSPQDRTYFLALGRLVPYKRFDLLIETCNRLRLPLKIAGTGSDERRLRAIAGPTVEVLGYVPQADLPSLYTHARAFLFPQIEDAGVAALEAQAAGTPVIALGQGGALDTVCDGITGILFPEQTSGSLEGALESWQKVSWDARAIRKHAEQFRLGSFVKTIQRAVETACTMPVKH